MAGALKHFLKAGGLRTWLTPSKEALLSVSVGGVRKAVFEFEQHDHRASASTGTVLWYADRILTKYLTAEAEAEAARPGGAHSFRSTTQGTARSRVALVLGSGGVPLSGIAACGLGWQVYLTDLKPITTQTQRNVERSLPTLRSFLDPRAQGGSSMQPPISVHELAWGDGEALASILPAVRPEQFVVLCSDCVFNPNLYRALLETISDALAWFKDGEGAPGDRGCHAGEALVMFQNRDVRGTASFMKMATQDFSLKLSAVDLRSSLTHVEWPAKVEEALAMGAIDNSDLSKEFLLYRMQLPL